MGAFAQSPAPAPQTADAGWAELAPRLASPEALRGAGWLQVAEQAWAFFAAHPADARRWNAWEPLLRSLPRFDQDAVQKRLWTDRVAAVEKAAADAADVPRGLRELLAGRKVSALVLPYTNGTLPDDWMTRLVPPIEALAAEFPASSSAFVYFARLTGAVESQAPAGMPELVERMAASPSATVRDYADKRRKVLAALAEPLDLKFVALDGSEVDTAQWRGKVVLVDFWATWCVPCVEAMPRLKDLYARYHAHGLEMVNVSPDRADARPALEKLVAKLELPWPQAFDGKAHASPFATRYGVQPIPHVLLAGPDGMVVAVNPSKEKLEAEIRRLLKL
jgi:thiol-disulfide isomerase/thioredoxin